MEHEACIRCAAQLESRCVCGSCLTHPPAFDASVAAFHYRFPVDQLLHRYKYGAHLALSGFFAERLVHAVREHALPDIVVAVPLSRERLAERGFNQAVVVANGVARSLGVRTAHDVLRRVRHTQPQAQLEWSSRQTNVKGAFASASGTHLQGRHVALVDDVMTTGATLNEAAAALKQGGAARVTVWVVARAGKEEGTMNRSESARV